MAGVESISIDMKDKKLTVIGNVDPVQVVNKLRKAWHTEIVSVGENKKEEPKKAEPKKEEPKKEAPKKEEGKKDPNELMAELIRAHQAYNPHLPMHYHVQSVEEDPNACVIC